MILSGKVRFLLFLWIVMSVGNGCIESPFYVSATNPSESAENVPRTSAIVVTVMAASNIPDEFLSANYIVLEDLGKDYHPQAEGSATPTSTPTTTSSSTESGGGQTKAPSTNKAERP